MLLYINKNKLPSDTLPHSPQCVTCGVDLTVKHILTERNNYETELNRKLNLNISEHLHTSLGRNPIPSNTMICFIKITNLYNQV